MKVKDVANKPHPSGIKCTNLIELMPYGVGNCFKHVWLENYEKALNYIKDVESMQYELRYRLSAYKMPVSNIQRLITFEPNATKRELFYYFITYNKTGLAKKLEEEVNAIRNELPQS